MRRRTATWLAWSLGALSVVMFVAAVVLYFVTRSVQPPSSWGTGGLSAVLIFLVPYLAFPVVGALIASRCPENPIGWICLAAGIFWMLNGMTSANQHLCNTGVFAIRFQPTPSLRSNDVAYSAGIGRIGHLR